MNCRYSKFSEQVEERGYRKLYCKIDNEICPFQYPCDIIKNWKNIDDVESKCSMFKKEVEKSNYLLGRYKVMFEMNGILAIKIPEIDQTREIKNPLDYVPEYVELVEVDNEYYIKGYAPK